MLITWAPQFLSVECNKSDNTQDFLLGVRPCRIYISFDHLVVEKNTDLFQTGEYHCTADLLFDWFGFDQTGKSVANSTLEKQLNSNKQEVSRRMILPVTK